MTVNHGVPGSSPGGGAVKQIGLRQTLYCHAGKQFHTMESGASFMAKEVVIKMTTSFLFMKASDSKQ
jgi:hypothetical protein